MLLSFSKKLVSKIPREDLNHLLSKLTVPGKSGMKEIIRDVDNNKLMAYIAYDNGTPIGWCILECRAKYYAQVYVKKSYRGYGIGRKLMQRAYVYARAKRKRLLVAKLDRSQKFFEHLSSSIRLFWHPMKRNDKTLLIKSTED